MNVIMPIPMPITYGGGSNTPISEEVLLYGTGFLIISFILSIIIFLENDGIDNIREGWEWNKPVSSILKLLSMLLLFYIPILGQFVASENHMLWW